MNPIAPVDFNTGMGLDEYCKKAKANLTVFEELFGKSPAEIEYKRFKIGGAENAALLEKIIDVTGFSRDVVLGTNAADEKLNGGCTSVAQDGVVGQTMDLFTVDLVVVREGDAVYITMPPYLTLMGMTKKIAFCTNFINGLVRDGVPVSNIRRNILRYKSLDEVKTYLLNVDRTTPVNFLISDGETALDVELDLNATKFHEERKSEQGRYCAHTNHLVGQNFEDDRYCDRLSRAVALLKEGKDIASILDDRVIKQRIMPVPFFNVDFGTIVHAIMDVKARTLKYKDPWMKEYATINV